jgi:Domain of unknown function (DUF222)
MPARTFVRIVSEGCRSVRFVAVAVVEADPETDPVSDPVAGELSRFLGWLGDRVAACRAGEQADDAVRIDRIGLLEQLTAAIAAVQVAESVRFAQSQVEAQQAAGWDPEKVGRGVADQIALACRTSPTEGSRRLGVARALWFDLPQTFDLLTRGRISDYAGRLVVNETRHLDAATRRDVDRQLVAERIETLGVRSIALRTRARAYAADPYGFVQRGRIERSQRRVGLRPAPDTMAILSAYLPVEQGVACYAALSRQTDSLRAHGDGRAKGQLMADTLVERLTGQAAADGVNIDVRLIMSPETLHADSSRPGWISGHSPLPAGLARELIGSAHGRVRYKVISEQIFADAAVVNPLPRDLRDRRIVRPAEEAGRSVNCAGEEDALAVVPSAPVRLSGNTSQRATEDKRGPRCYTGQLREVVEIRDHSCRDPFCDAPIRHIDHIQRHADGGPTNVPNARGVCERGNYLRELPGWTVTMMDAGPPHTVMITTPTGHSYTSQAPQPP